MKKLVVCSLLVAFSASGAFAGDAIFDPAVATAIVGSGDVVSLNISMDSSAFPLTGGFDAILGSNDAPFTFDWAPGFVLDSMTLSPSTGTYTYDYFIGGNSTVSDPLPMPVWMGVVKVDTAALPIGSYTFGIDPSVDGFSTVYDADGVGDPLSGFGTVRITPEPATLALLAMGGLVALRRRR